MTTANSEGLEEGEIEEKDADEKDRSEMFNRQFQGRRKQNIRPNCEIDHRIHSRSPYPSKPPKRFGNKFKKQHIIRPRRQKVEDSPGLMIREWPKMFMHIKNDVPLDGGRSRTCMWEGSPRSPPRSPARGEIKPERHHLWARAQQPFPHMGRPIRQRPRQPFNNKRNSSHDELSYEDLLAQYKEIKSQLAELNRQENSSFAIHSTEDETLNKENLKNESRRTRHTRNEDKSCKLKSDKNLPRNTSATKNRRRSRTRSLSSSRSQGIEVKLVQDEEDVQELRRIALESARLRPSVKNQEAKNIHASNLPSSPSGVEPLNNINEQLYDNYDEVEMELDSNCESAKDESDDEEELRKNVLLSLNQKQQSRNKEQPTKASSDIPTDTPVNQQLEQKGPTSNIPQIPVVPSSNIVPPVHKRVVINLAEDSSDSEQDEDHSISADVSRFLKEARQKADAQQQAVTRLSGAQLEEYCRLKEEIAKREQPKKNVLQPTVDEGIVSPTIEAINEEWHRKRIKIMEQKKKDEQQLQTLQDTLIKKKSLLLMAEQKVKRLQEQLAAAQRVVAANKNSMLKLNSQIKLIQKRMNDQKQELLIGNSKEKLVISNIKKRQLSSQSIQNNVKRLRLSFRTKINVDKNNSKLILSAQERADEKARLQRMEQEISAKLDALRRIKGLHQSTKPNFKWKAPADVTPQKVVPHSNNKNVPSLKNDINNLNSHLSPDQLTSTDIVDLKEIQENTMKKILSTDSRTCVSITKSKWDFMFFPIISKIQSLDINTSDISSHTKNTECLEKTRPVNPLLHLKSSRLLPTFLGNFTSSTYANKIDPNWTLCSYDLMGTCNDDKCPRQHARDYSIKPEEIIADLVSYCPQLCGLSSGSDVESSKDTIKKYAEKILQKTSNHVSLEEICTQVVNEIRHQLDLGCRLQDSPRPWKIQQEPRSKLGTSNEGFNLLFPPNWDVMLPVSEDNPRYFSMDNYHIGDMESKLSKDPCNVQMWLKHANYYLNRKDRSSKTNLDQALHVLSRALENNQGSEELWLQYLTLYRQHPDSDDITQLCQEALSFIPSYDIWWRHLNYTKECKTKLEISNQIINYIKGLSEAPEIISHRLLETVLYQVHLNVQIGCLEDALKILQENLENYAENKLLTGKDLCIAWLSLIHLKIFDTLPALLFDASNDNPGHLVNKVPVLISWQSCLPHHESAVLFLNEAISQCIQHDVPLIDIMPLYKNLIALHFHKKSFHLAEEICQDLIKHLPSEEDSWILLATVFFQKSDFRGCLTTFQTALNFLHHSPRIHLLTAVVAQSSDSKESALEWLTRSIRNLLNTDQGDPDILFRYALGFTLSVDIQMPPVTPLPFQKDEPVMMYIWLSYCTFLQLQRRHCEIADVLEIALATLTLTEPLQNIWIYYLHSVAQSLSLSPREDGPKIWACLVRRCLISIPTRIRVHNETHYLQEFHGEISELLLANVNPCQIRNTLDILHSWLPYNSWVFLRYLKLLMEEENYQTVASLMSEATGNNLRNEKASQLAIFAAQRVLPNDQICNFYHHLSSALPYSYKLWEDSITSMEVLGNEEGAVYLRKCCSQYLDETRTARLQNTSLENQSSTKQKIGRTHPPEDNVSINLAGSGGS